MTGLEHSLLATGLLAVFYYLGAHFGKKDAVEAAVEFTLDTLEKGNYVKVLYNEKTKEKELIPLDKTS